MAVTARTEKTAVMAVTVRRTALMAVMTLISHDQLAGWT